MDRETIVYEYRMNGMSEDDAEIHADIYCSKLDELANLRAENERLREVLRIIYASVFNDNGDVTYDTSGLFKASRIAKEALK